MIISAERLHAGAYPPRETLRGGWISVNHIIASPGAGEYMPAMLVGAFSDAELRAIGYGHPPGWDRAFDAWARQLGLDLTSPSAYARARELYMGETAGYYAQSYSVAEQEALAATPVTADGYPVYASPVYSPNREGGA